MVNSRGITIFACVVQFSQHRVTTDPMNSAFPVHGTIHFPLLLGRNHHGPRKSGKATPPQLQHLLVRAHPMGVNSAPANPVRSSHMAVVPTNAAVFAVSLKEAVRPRATASFRFLINNAERSVIPYLGCSDAPPPPIHHLTTHRLMMTTEHSCEHLAVMTPSATWKKWHDNRKNFLDRKNSISCALCPI